MLEALARAVPQAAKHFGFSVGSRGRWLRTALSTPRVVPMPPPPRPELDVLDTSLPFSPLPSTMAGPLFTDAEENELREVLRAANLHLLALRPARVIWAIDVFQG
eukprot:11212459-Lingulodinium_polyedra.AAC.1